MKLFSSKHISSCLLLLTAGLPAIAQSDTTWDSSGNAFLQGPYNYRQVVWVVGDDAGNFKRSVALTGTINFDGQGAYTISASVMDSTVNTLQTLNSTGTYSISAGGYGFISSPVVEGGRVFGVVSQGIFVASSTEDLLNDLLIAAPAGSTASTDAGFNGRYWIAEVNFPSNNVAQARDALFQINPDGLGSLGTINATGYIGGSGTKVAQTLAGVRYSFTNGVGTVSFGGTLTPQTLLADSRSLFLSPDGNFVFGDSPNGWNMLVGVRALSESAPPDLLNGLYYQAGVDVDEGQLADGFATIHSYYGSFSASGGVQINHQRLLNGFDEAPYDFTYSDIYEVDANGVYQDFIGFQNIIGAGGAIRIGFGQGTSPGISVAVKAPSFSGPDVYLNPAGIINAASFSPFTVGVSRGQMITMNGTNLAAVTKEDATFPTTLEGVQVMVNNRPAPIRSVSPTQILALVPFATAESIARIHVINNGVESNKVSMYVNITSPGVFTVPPGGAGYADALHADGSKVTKASPAKTGETISVALTGLGDVDPTVPDGTAGPASPRSKALPSTAAYVDGTKADVPFAGLAPGTIGLYQMDITVPSSVAAGDLYLDIAGPDSYTTQAQIPVVRSGADELQPSLFGPGEERKHSVPRRRPTGVRHPRGVVHR